MNDSTSNSGADSTSNGPESPQPPRRPNSHRFWLILFSKPVLGTLAVLAGVLGVAAWRAYSYVQTELAPEIERSLTRSLNRPVRLGKLQSSGLTSLRFGPSQIPAVTPSEVRETAPPGTRPAPNQPNQTAAPDSLQVQGIDVAFDPWQLVWQRKLELQVTLQEPQLNLVQTADGKWLRTEFVPQPQTGWLQTELTAVKFENAMVQALPLGEKVRQFQQVNGNLQLLTATNPNTPANPPSLKFDLQGQAVGGGTLKLRGNWATQTQTAQLTLNTDALNATLLNGVVLPAIDPSYLGKGNSVYQLAGGKIDSQLEVLVAANGDTQVFGTAQVSQISGKLTGLNQPFQNLRGALRLQGPVTYLEGIQGNYGAIPFQTQGSVDWRKGFDLAGQLPPIDANVAAKTLEVVSPVPIAGKVRVPDLRLTGTIANPKLSGTVFSVGAAKIDKLDLRGAAARFELTAPQLALTAIQADPVVGGQIRGQGRYSLLTGGRWLTELQATNLPGTALANLYNVKSPMALGTVSAIIQQGGTAENLVTQVQFQAPQAQYPIRGQAILQGDKVWFDNVVARIGAATVQAKGIVQQNQWQLTAATRNLPLTTLDPKQRGTLSGIFNLAGQVGEFRPETLQANGQVLLSEGIGDLNQPLQAVVQWQGAQQQIRVLEARTPGIVASGILSTQFVNSRTGQQPEITGINLDVAAQNYDLQALGLTNLPANTTLQGRADFRGRLTGSPENLSVAGVIRTRSLQVNQLAFEPGMLGRVNYAPNRGANLQLQGRRDRIGLNLDGKLQPLAFVVQRDQASAVGQRQGDNLQVAIRRFPLTSLPVAAVNPGTGPVGGLLSGDLQLNLPALMASSPTRQQQAVGQFEISRPFWNGVTADRITTSVRMANGVIAFPDGLVQRGGRQYRFNGRLSTGNDPQLVAQVNTVDGQIQDLLPILRSAGYTPPPRRTYTAAAVTPKPVGNAKASLASQMQLLNQIDRQIVQTRTQTSQPLDLSLEQLQGPFNGQVNVVGSRRGVDAGFSLQSQQLTLGDTKLEQAALQGNFRNGVTQLKTALLALQGGRVQFSGTLGGKKQRGDLTIDNFPLDVLQRLAGLTQLDLTGKLNGRATLAGNLANPKLQGQLNLQQAKINQQPVTSANAQFNYNQGRLQFNSTALMASTTEPVQIVGTVPLGIGNRPNRNDRLSVDLSVRNQGLSLLNLFTNDQLTWLGGEGAVNLQVAGTLQQPTINGLITLNQASLQSALFSQPLTGVTGQIRFGRDRLNVEQLTAQYSTGQATATGVLPLNSPLTSTDPDAQRPLQLSLNQADARVPNLYNGQINGNLVVTGTVFQPVLGGTIQLSNGEILLNDTETLTANNRPGSSPIPGSNGFNSSVNPLSPRNSASLGLTASLPMLVSALGPNSSKAGKQDTSPRLNQLQVQLGENIRISSAPLFSFMGQGSITLNGSLGDIQPQGRVDFKRGQVNLFTSRFRLASDNPNFAEFRPNYGLDPVLNITLMTTGTEVYGSRANRLDEFEPLPFASLGALNSVRVQAKVTGRASQLESNFRNSVELTSTPARSEEEIIAMLGGWSGPSRRNDPTLALANLAGSALFNRVQGVVNDYLGNRVNFRLFPTLIPVNAEQRATVSSSGSVLGLGAEVGFDLTRQLSVSAIQVLTAPDNPTQFNLGYQLNDRWRFSTSIDVAGQGVGLVEYRVRF
jgi:translocation and assembly module TamB